MNRAPLAILLLLLLTLGGGAAAYSEGIAGDELDLPNLAPLPAHDLRIGPADDGEGLALRFAVTTVNFGAHPLDLLPVAIDAESAHAHQCVRWAAPRVCSERREVGHLMWHAGHHHFHLQDFAEFELRTVDEHHEPIPGQEGLVARSRKLGFCLAELARHHDAGPAYRTPYYLACFGTLGYQGLSPGWQDTYSPTRSGQQIPLDDIADGTYALLITIDPDARLHETTREDNTSVRLLELEGGGVYPLDR
jgi:hypothetical protein